MDNEQLEEVKDNEDSPEQKANKETKKYLRVIEIVKSVVGGEDKLRPAKKVTADETATLVAELFAEEGEELRKKVKDGLKALLRQHVELEAKVAAKKKELEDTQLAQRKEFTKAANTWLKQIDENEVKSESYAAALKTAFTEQKEKE